MPFATFSHTQIVQMFLGSLCSVVAGQQTSTSKPALFFWPKVTFVVLWHLLSLACLPPFSTRCSAVGIWSLDSVLSTQYSVLLVPFVVSFAHPLSVYPCQQTKHFATPCNIHACLGLWSFDLFLVILFLCQLEGTCQNTCTLFIHSLSLF